jgi:hypothetical protein
VIAPDARALGPVDLEVGAKVGGATSPSSVSGSADPLGLGIGARAGLSFAGGFYAGGTVIYYLGNTQNATGPCTGATTNPADCGQASVSLHTLMYGGELGYGITILDLLTLRPQVGLGNATFTANNGGNSQTSNYWYLEPGLTALLGFGLLYVGADANALFFPSLPDNQAAFSLHAQAGVKF